MGITRIIALFIWVTHLLTKFPLTRQVGSNSGMTSDAGLEGARRCSSDHTILGHTRGTCAYTFPLAKVTLNTKPLSLFHVPDVGTQGLTFPRLLMLWLLVDMLH